MTLTQLRYLVAIADAELNITLAASRVHATQPGLSKQLKQLEDELGFLLFVRKGRSLESVTPAGTEVIAHPHLRGQPAPREPGPADPDHHPHPGALRPAAGGGSDQAGLSPGERAPAAGR